MFTWKVAQCNRKKHILCEQPLPVNKTIILPTRRTLQQYNHRPTIGCHSHKTNEKKFNFWKTCLETLRFTAPPLVFLSSKCKTKQKNERSKDNLIKIEQRIYSLPCHVRDTAKDSRITVKHVHLVHVHIEKHALCERSLHSTFAASHILKILSSIWMKFHL